MAFVLKQSRTYWWPIELIIPADGGRKEKFALEVEFRRVGQTRLNKIMAIARDVERGRAEPDEVEDQILAKEILVGWKEVVDDDGEDIPFTDAALTELLEIETVAGQILKHFFDSIKSEEKPGKRKN
jgi:hypothetical protein